MKQKSSFQHHTPPETRPTAAQAPPGHNHPDRQQDRMKNATIIGTAAKYARQARPTAGTETTAQPDNPPTSCGITRHHADNMRKPPACRNGDSFRTLHCCYLAARPVPALPSPSLIRHCTGILHRHDIIPVSCGQLREQHAFSLYRQRLAPPARQTGISGVPSPLHPVFRHPAPPVPATKRTTPGKAQPSGKRRHSGETLRRQHATRPAFRHPPAKKPPVRCRNGRFFHGLRSAVPSSPLFQSR